MPNEADVISGGPLEHGSPVVETPTPPKEPVETPPAAIEMVEAEIGGVKVQVPKVFADQYNQMMVEVSTINARLRAMEKPPAPKDELDPLDDADVAIFSDPKGTLRKVIEIAKAEVTQSVKAEAQTTRLQEEFWKEFYKTHDDLDPDIDGPVVQVTMAREFQTMKNMKSKDAIKYLGEQSKAQLLKIAAKRGAPASKPTKPTSEGANEPSTSRSKQKDTSVSTHKPQSIVDVLRVRRAARMKATKG
jgi:hypothetical protein